jgi:hypothetical protein
MHADTSNTSSVAFALTGATPAVPVPIWIRITAPGVGNVYYDGLGVTPAMVGVTIVDSVNIVLTGAGLGMAITPGVGSQVAGDTWQATCSGLADQSGSGKNFAQLTPAAQPIVTTGLNGKPGLLFDGIDDFLRSSVQTLLTALPFQGVVVARLLTATTNDRILYGCDGLSCALFGNAPNQITMYNGSFGPAGPITTAATRYSATYTGTAADELLAGSNSATGVNAGPAIPSSSNAFTDIARLAVLGTFGKIEFFMLTFIPPTPLGSFDAALNSPGGYGPGAILV